MLLGAYRQPATSLDTIDRAASPLWICAQALRDPGNIGTILRTGDAVGAGGLILIDDSADPFSVEAVRASMGAIFTQKLALARWDEFLPWLRSGSGSSVSPRAGACLAGSPTTSSTRAPSSRRGNTSATFAGSSSVRWVMRV